MLKHGLFALCERASIDKTTEALILTHCIETIGTDKLPAHIPRLFIVATWLNVGDNAKTENAHVRVSLLPPHESQLILGEMTNEVAPGDSLKLVGEIAIQLSSAGLYMFQLEREEENKWVLVGEFPVVVKITPPAADQTTAP